MKHLRLISVILGVTLAAAAAADAASSPSGTTGGTSGVTQTTATLLGTVTPNGAATSSYFDLGLTSAYGLTTKVRAVGSGTKPVSVKALTDGLIPGTTYHYRVEATNRYGTTAGADHTFTTVGPPPPQASTGPATNVGVNSVTLTGVINPNGGDTGYRFQYGLSSNYGTYTNGGTVPAGSKPVVVTETISGLAKGTEFHYRLVAFHGLLASAEGSDVVFMTEPQPKPKPTVTATTRPRTAAHRPFTFTTSGKVRGPASIPSMFDCTGYVAVRLFYGARSVAFELAPVQSDCSYAATTKLARIPGRGAQRGRRVAVRVAVRFRGNGYLTSANARSRFVNVG